jgi:hypothetical protein
MPQFRTRPILNVTVDPELRRDLERRAERANEPLSQVVERVLRAGLGAVDAQIVNPRDPAPRTA